MNPRWLFRMKRWAQNPPSQSRVIFVFAIIAICLSLAAVEYFIGWPDALSIERGGWKWRP
ncbi:MAG: hypothetical protein AB8B82_02355 [Roseovarius sp.]